jgi:hypothetical protein
MEKEELAISINQLSSQSSKNKVWIWILLGAIALVIIIILLLIFIPTKEKLIGNLYETSTNGNISINSIVYIKEEFQAKSQEEAVLDAVNINLIKLINCMLDNSEDKNSYNLCPYFINQDLLRKTYLNVTYFQKYPKKMIFNMSKIKVGKEEGRENFNLMLEEYSKIYDLEVITYSLDKFNKADIEIINLDCSSKISFTVKNKGSVNVELHFNAIYHNAAGERVQSRVVNDVKDNLTSGVSKSFNFEKNKFINEVGGISEKGIEQIEVEAWVDNPQLEREKNIFTFDKNCS